MIIMFITDGFNLSFPIFMTFPEPSMCMSGIGLFTVWSGVSVLYFSSSSKCRTLVLNRNFLYVGIGVLPGRQVLDAGISWDHWKMMELSIHLGSHCI